MMPGILALLTLALAGAAGQTDGVPSPREEDLSSEKLRIEWTEFKKLYDAGKVEIIDVRDPAAFEMGHIPGARSIPLADVEKHVPELRKLNKPIVLYCS